jgi:hypothetical protein
MLPVKYEKTLVCVMVTSQFLFASTINRTQLFIPLALQPNLGLDSLHETFRLTSVTGSRTLGRTPLAGDQLVVRPLPVHKHRKTHTLNIHARVGIRNHDHSVRVGEDSSCLKSLRLRPFGYRDRHRTQYCMIILLFHTDQPAM